MAIFCGHEIQMYDGPTGEPQKTGSVYNFQPLNLAQAEPLGKGEWSDYEIRIVGQDYTIIRNGKVINRSTTRSRRSRRAGATRRRRSVSSTAATSACRTTAAPT